MADHDYPERVAKKENTTETTRKERDGLFGFAPLRSKDPAQFMDSKAKETKAGNNGTS